MDEQKIPENSSLENAEEKEEIKAFETGGEETVQTQEVKKAEKENSFISDIMEIVESVLISVFAVLLIFTFVARPVTVDGDSMNPTLINEDKLIMWTFMYTPDNGDIVIVNNERSNTIDENGNVIESTEALDKRLIKRVVATGGQTLEIKPETGEVIVDGEVLKEDYINAILTSGGVFEYPLTIPEGYIFVMGDNRNHSTDSRSGYVGLINEEDVIGEAIFRFYPFESFSSLK